MNCIPFLSLAPQHLLLRAEMDRAIAQTIDSGQFVLGQAVKAFEHEYAHFSGTRFCVAMGNGLDALTAALASLEIRAGDEVLVPSHTCYATWLAVDKVGAVPVPVDVDPQTFVIRPELIEAGITKRTKAIIAVHLYGYPCAMDSIISIAQKSNLFVIEDNAQAQGAIYHGRATGSWGDVNATSFYPTKNLGALGDGGAVTTHDEQRAKFVAAFRHYGAIEKDVFNYRGINSRLDEIQAAILSVKLKALPQWNEERRMLAARYQTLLAGIGDLQLPALGNEEVLPVFHLYVIQTEHRDALRSHLIQHGIETAIHYPVPIHQQAAFKSLDYSSAALPIAEKLSQTILSLPLWPGMTSEQQEHIAQTIKNFF